MEKAQEILLHIDELYTENPSEDKILHLAENNPTRYQAWVDAFKDYDLSDVLRAIDEFWEYKNSKTKPNVAQIKAILNAHRAETIKETAEVKELPTAYHFWKQDGESGDLKYFLSDYERAFNLCINDYLAQVIPAEEFSRMSWQRRIRSALDNGVLNRMPSALQAVCEKPRFLSDNEYKAIHGAAYKVNLPQNDKGFTTPQVGVLSAHYRSAA